MSCEYAEGVSCSRDVAKVEQPEVANVPVTTLVCEDDGIIIRHTYQQCARFKNSEILADLNSHLSNLTDHQRCDKHDIDVSNAVPVKQHAYQGNTLKRSVMKTKVEYLFECIVFDLKLILPNA